MKHSRNMWKKAVLCLLAAVLLTGCRSKAGKEHTRGEASPSDVSSETGFDDGSYEDEDIPPYVDASSMTFTEIGSILGKLGIDVDDEVLSRAETDWDALSAEESDACNKIGWLLARVGSGSYNKSEKKFTPSSDKVYCFDEEKGARDVSLECFFEGVSAISGGDIAITDVDLEPVSEEDKKSDVYHRTLRFRLNRKSCSYNAEFYYGWFDTNLIEYINKQLEKQKIADRLYYMVDNSTCEVFYCDEKWAKEFHAKTGCELMCGGDM